MAHRTWPARICAAAHSVALTFWVGLLIAAGVAATGAFATLPDLGISLRGFEGFATGNPADHGRLAAGKMLEAVFSGIDFAQVPLAVIAIAAFAMQLILSGDSWRRPSHIVRLTSMLVAAGLLAVHVSFVAPPMNRELRAYWAAAEAGNSAAAIAHRTVFDEYHPRAERVLQINLLLLFTAVGAAGVSCVVRKAPLERSDLETPLLARRRT
jgi:hypothetical protein